MKPKDTGMKLICSILKMMMQMKTIAIMITKTTLRLTMKMKAEMMNLQMITRKMIWNLLIPKSQIM